jgi:hypothetical protein
MEYAGNAVIEADVFKEAVQKIEGEYRRLGHRRDWRFLTAPRRTLGPETRTALISLHPGGEGAELGQGKESCEAGSAAYINESWHGCRPGESKLQKQVMGLFEWLGENPNETLSAYFIPFRVPRFEDLHERDASLEFASTLWKRLFQTIRPTLVICLGAETFKGVGAILSDIRGPPIRDTKFLVGWGEQKATLVQYREGLLLRFPHLSRFAIFERPQSTAYLTTILHEIRELRQPIEARTS